MTATERLLALLDERESGGRVSITDELRKWVTAYPWREDKEAAQVHHLIDRIDTEHEQMQYDFQREFDEWKHDRDTCWVKLPVSEDGDVLHIGELVDEKLPFGGYAAPAPIDTMELSRGANGYVWMVKLDTENRALINPKLLRHHHAPTVEDVLREMADRIYADEDEPRDRDAIVAEYAQRLQLREVDE